MAFPAFLDTCVLYPAALTDLLLRIAEHEVYRPHWSPDVVAELQRNLAKVVAEEAARRRIDAMCRAFPEASVTGYESLVDGMTCDPKDRHVLAAATHSGCQVIVTANIKDFPAESLTPYDMTVVTPDDFLLDQLDLYPGAVRSALIGQCQDTRRPQLTRSTLFSSLERAGVPRFVAEARRKVSFVD